MLILTVNPGSTSTKIALFEDLDLIVNETVRHSQRILSAFDELIDQLEMRKNVIVKFLSKNNYTLDQIDGFIGRGGLVKPVKSGIYKVNKEMINDLSSEKYGGHASNLGGIIVYEMAKSVGKDAFIADPVVVDEMSSVAKISGLNGISRRPLWHALNQKAVARKYADKIGLKYEDVNLIVAHLGGGISVGAHELGRVIDVNNALDGDGPMSPERSGGLPNGPLYKMALSGKYTLKEIQRMNYGNGGLVAYLGTNDGFEIDKRIKSGDEKALFMVKVMCYQIAKEIGACATVLKGNVDAIVITGGLAYDQLILDLIKERVSFISDILVFPGEDEMEALAYGALRVLTDQEKFKEYL